MQRLVEDIRSVICAGPINGDAIAAMEERLRSAMARLRTTSLYSQPLKPGRYLCYKDADYGFVVMVLAWGPGDGTPIHDHGCWGVEGVLKNSLRVTTYNESPENPEALSSSLLPEGSVLHNLPPARDIHKVEHGGGDYALSVHVYGKEMTGNRSFFPGEGYKVCRLECRQLRIEDFDSSIVVPAPQGSQARV